MSDLLGMQRAVWRSKRSTTEKIVLLAILVWFLFAYRGRTAVGRDMTDG